MNVDDDEDENTHQTNKQTNNGQYQITELTGMDKIGIEFDGTKFMLLNIDIKKLNSFLLSTKY